MARFHLLLCHLLHLRFCNSAGPTSAAGVVAGLRSELEGQAVEVVDSNHPRNYGAAPSNDVVLEQEWHAAASSPIQMEMAQQVQVPASEVLVPSSSERAPSRPPARRLRSAEMRLIHAFNFLHYNGRAGQFAKDNQRECRICQGKMVADASRNRYATPRKKYQQPVVVLSCGHTLCRHCAERQRRDCAAVQCWSCRREATWVVHHDHDMEHGDRIRAARLLANMIDSDAEGNEEEEGQGEHDLGRSPQAGAEPEVGEEQQVQVEEQEVASSTYAALEEGRSSRASSSASPAPLPLLGPQSAWDRTTSMLDRLPTWRTPSRSLSRHDVPNSKSAAVAAKAKATPRGRRGGAWPPRRSSTAQWQAQESKLDYSIMLGACLQDLDCCVDVDEAKNDAEGADMKDTESDPSPVDADQAEQEEQGGKLQEGGERHSAKEETATSDGDEELPARPAAGSSSSAATPLLAKKHRQSQADADEQPAEGGAAPRLCRNFAPGAGSCRSCREELCPWQQCYPQALSVARDMDPILSLFADATPTAPEEMKVVVTDETRPELWQQALAYVNQEQDRYERMAEEAGLQTKPRRSVSSFLQFRAVVDLLDQVGFAAVARILYRQMRLIYNGDNEGDTMLQLEAAFWRVANQESVRERKEMPLHSERGRGGAGSTSIMEAAAAAAPSASAQLDITGGSAERETDEDAQRRVAPAESTWSQIFNNELEQLEIGGEWHSLLDGEREGEEGAAPAPVPDEVPHTQELELTLTDQEDEQARLRCEEEEMRLHLTTSSEDEVEEEPPTPSQISWRNFTSSHPSSGSGSADPRDARPPGGPSRGRGSRSRGRGARRRHGHNVDEAEDAAREFLEDIGFAPTTRTQRRSRSRAAGGGTGSSSSASASALPRADQLLSRVHEATPQPVLDCCDRAATLCASACQAAACTLNAAGHAAGRACRFCCCDVVCPAFNCVTPIYSDVQCARMNLEFLAKVVDVCAHTHHLTPACCAKSCCVGSCIGSAWCGANALCLGLFRPASLMSSKGGAASRYYNYSTAAWLSERHAAFLDGVQDQNQGLAQALRDYEEARAARAGEEHQRPGEQVQLHPYDSQVCGGTDLRNLFHLRPEEYPCAAAGNALCFSLCDPLARVAHSSRSCCCCVVSCNRCVSCRLTPGCQLERDLLVEPYIEAVRTAGDALQAVSNCCVCFNVNVVAPVLETCLGPEHAASITASCSTCSSRCTERCAERCRGAFGGDEFLESCGQFCTQLAQSIRQACDPEDRAGTSGRGRSMGLSPMGEPSTSTPPEGRSSTRGDVTMTSSRSQLLQLLRAPRSVAGEHMFVPQEAEDDAERHEQREGGRSPSSRPTVTEEDAARSPSSSSTAVPAAAAAVAVGPPMQIQMQVREAAGAGGGAAAHRNERKNSLSLMGQSFPPYMAVDVDEVPYVPLREEGAAAASTYRSSFSAVAQDDAGSTRVDGGAVPSSQLETPPTAVRPSNGNMFRENSNTATSSTFTGVRLDSPADGSSHVHVDNVAAAGTFAVPSSRSPPAGESIDELGAGVWAARHGKARTRGKTSIADVLSYPHPDAAAAEEVAVRELMMLFLAKDPSTSFPDPAEVPGEGRGKRKRLDKSLAGAKNRASRWKDLVSSMFLHGREPDVADMLQAAVATNPNLVPSDAGCEMLMRNRAAKHLLKNLWLALQHRRELSQELEYF